MSWNYQKNSTGYEHIAIAEKALGKSLPQGAEVHHLNGDGRDNQPENLIILQNRAEHMAMHYRERAYDASGHAHYVKCEYCKQYDDPDNDMYTQARPKSGFRARHRSCHREANRR